MRPGMVVAGLTWRPVEIDLARDEWESAAQAHAERADRLTAGHRQRRLTGTPHAVEDFLFTYYRFSPTALRRWSPGAGVRMRDAAGHEIARQRFMVAAGPDVRVDRTAYLQERGELARFVRELVITTAGRPPQWGCFARHEWAMVYRMTPEQVRHQSLPLRLDPRETDAVVEAAPLVCTHFDAYRFFTEPARPLNTRTLTRDAVMHHEQPGCLHAGMDLYTWAMKLAPGIPSELALDCFELAMRLRALDMRASPYDTTSLGYTPIAIETPTGRAEFTALQREYAASAQVLRRRLADACDLVLAEQLDAQRQ